MLGKGVAKPRGEVGCYLDTSADKTRLMQAGGRNGHITPVHMFSATAVRRAAGAWDDAAMWLARASSDTLLS